MKVEMKKGEVIIRSMQEKDRAEVLEMMQIFYASDVVIHKADDETLQKDISDCVETAHTWMDMCLKSKVKLPDMELQRPDIQPNLAVCVSGWKICI